MKYNDDGTYEDIVIKAVATGRNSYSSSQQEVYSCDYTNKLIKTGQTSSDSATYSCNYIDGTVLYESSEGATTGATLSDNISNYRYLEVLAKTGSYGTSNKIDLSITTTMEFLSLYASRDVFALKDSVYSFSGTSMTRDLMYTKYSNATYDTTNENGIRIYKVIGYK